MAFLFQPRSCYLLLAGRKTNTTIYSIFVWLFLVFLIIGEWMALEYKNYRGGVGLFQINNMLKCYREARLQNSTRRISIGCSICIWALARRTLHYNVCVCVSCSRNQKNEKRVSRDLHKCNTHWATDFGSSRPSVGMLKCRYKNVNMSGESGCVFFCSMVIRRCKNDGFSSTLARVQLQKRLKRPIEHFKLDANYLAHAKNPRAAFATAA